MDVRIEYRPDFRAVALLDAATGEPLQEVEGWEWEIGRDILGWLCGGGCQRGEPPPPVNERGVIRFKDGREVLMGRVTFSVSAAPDPSGRLAAHLQGIRVRPPLRLGFDGDELEAGPSWHWSNGQPW